MSTDTSRPSGVAVQWTMISVIFRVVFGCLRITVDAIDAEFGLVGASGNKAASVTGPAIPSADAWFVAKRNQALLDG
ncbi:hypothetical protein [Shinella kummerowiae]|uniref:hypothetical protein n=1 Tax=Shinella kummerowiae TaxID=417745 RepID=UPI0021B66CE0|nr:hypothetical protein [Shinella kummerowiae]MCT7665493.1 hypothetical protein [Shinella kummerowiae]